VDAGLAYLSVVIFLSFRRGILRCGPSCFLLFCTPKFELGQLAHLAVFRHVNLHNLRKSVDRLAFVVSSLGNFGPSRDFGRMKTHVCNAA
jgi:hypothetical protein